MRQRLLNMTKITHKCHLVLVIIIIAYSSRFSSYTINVISFHVTMVNDNKV